MGQVSLPVLSRKGNNDNWNYVWTSFKNYSLLFNEDLFLKQFIFLFFMYGISFNKMFMPIFFAPRGFKPKQTQTNTYNITNLICADIINLLKKKPRNKFYTSKIFLCRHINWIYIYIFIYSLTNRKLKQLLTARHQKFFNKDLFYQSYLVAKYNYLLKFLESRQ